MFTAQAGWDTGLILTPIVSYNNMATTEQAFDSARLGGVLGMHYKHDSLVGLHGRTRGVYQQNFFSQANFREIKVGSYIGPKLGPIYLEFGADYMINEYDIAGVYTGAFSSLATPVRAKFDVGMAHAEVAAGPIFFMDSISGEERQSIKTPFGFGDEFFVMAAANIDIKPLISLASVGVSASRRFTAYGDDTVIGAELSILFFGLGSSGHAY